MPHRFEASNKELLRDERRREVQPAEGIIERARVHRDDVCVDLGAGVGYISVPVALKCQAVVAVDSQREMLDALWGSLSEFSRSKVYPVLASADRLPFSSPAFDHAFVVNMFHEVPDRNRFAAEIERTVYPGGKVTVVDFQKKPTSFGPPVSERMTAQEILAYFPSLSLEREYSFDEFYQLECVRL